MEKTVLRTRLTSHCRSLASTSFHSLRKLFLVQRGDVTELLILLTLC